MEYRKVRITKIIRWIIEREKPILLCTVSLICAITITLGILGLMIKTTSWTVNQNIKNLQYLTDRNKAEGSKLKRLNEITTEQAKKLVIKTRSDYYDDLEIAILSSYARNGQWKNKRKVRGLIETSFTVAEELYPKGLITYYGKDIRDCALNALGEVRKETDFDVFDEFSREWNPRNKTWDYGAWRVNDVHIKNSPSIFYKMYKMGIWKADGDNYLCHPITNCKARMIIVNERIKKKWDTWNMDKTLKKILEGIDGFKSKQER